VSKNIVDSTTKAAAEILKAVPVYEDALQPVAKEVGKALKTVGGVINIALTPLSAMVYGWDVIKDQLKIRLEKRLSKVSLNNIVSPSLQVVGPLLDRYKYVHNNEELANMFVNLLANAMEKNNVEKAHPSFVNIISELSPDEAKIIKHFSRHPLLPKIDVKIRSKEQDTKGYIYVVQNFTLLGSEAKLDFPDMTTSYISNLERLKIITCSSGQFQEYIVKEGSYDPLEKDMLISNIKSQYESTHNIEIVKGHIRTTEYGNMFMRAVLDLK
jgi:hypothetical protein